MGNITALTQGETKQATPLPVQLRYCLYARKSSDESSERQIMSIDSQVKEMLQLAQREGLEVNEIKRESHSAKDTGQRPVFNKMLEEIRLGRFNAILTWAPDRLSRNAGDLGALVDLLDQKILFEVRTFSQKFTNNPNEKFLLMILGSQAKLENDNKGQNVQRGLRAKCQLGLWPAPAPTGYRNNPDRGKKCHVVIDTQRAPVIKEMFEKVGYQGWSGRKLFRWLRDINFTSVNGNLLWLSNIYTILDNPFYYGEFEYPRKSGNWYKGVHEPIITKEVFMAVQKQIHLEQDVKYEKKEFAFTKLMRCGKCGSGVTADDKYKKLKDGSTAKYIYYGCTRARDLSCKSGYIREEELILQFVGLVDTLSINELGLRKRLNDEFQRYQKFQTMLGIQKSDARSVDADMKNYAKYILREGNIFEKRELLTYLKDRILLANKVITLVK